jgi:hypothetical protein
LLKLNNSNTTRTLLSLFALLSLLIFAGANKNIKAAEIDKQAEQDNLVPQELVQEELVQKESIQQERFQQVIVNEPFIELHSGPGRGFPVFYIVEKNDNVFLLKKKTEWYKIQTADGKQGWAHESEIVKTLNLSGENYQINKANQQGFIERDYEVGVLSGNFSGARSITFYSGWSWTDNISTEISYSQVVGQVSEVQFINASIMHQPFPEWRVSPYFKLGGGVIKTKPNSTIIFAEDRSDEMLHAGVGFRVYISRQFFMRAEYNSHTILTSRNNNDDVEEWKLGFSVFF